MPGLKPSFQTSNIEHRTSNVPFLFGLLLYLLFCGVTPVYYWFIGEDSIAGLPYAAARGEAFWVYAIGLLVFAGVYAVLPNWKVRARWAALSVTPGLAWSLIAVCMVAIVANLYMSGATTGGLWHLFMGQPGSAPIWGLPIAAPWFEGFTDSLIAVVLLVVVAQTGKLRWVKGLGLAVLLLGVSYYLLLTGWRFRLLLLGAAGLGLVWQSAGRNRRRWVAVAMVLVLPAVLFLFHNRAILATGQWQLLGQHTSPFSLQVLARETSNSQTFMRVLVWRDSTKNGPDWGHSTLGYLALRPIPGRFFAGGHKPLPPMHRHIFAAFSGTAQGQRLRPAVTNPEEYYLGGTWLGLVLGMAGMAALCRLLGSVLAQANTPASRLLGWVGTAFLYQLISRGHLPQQAQLAFFLLWPFAALYLYALWRPHPA